MTLLEALDRELIAYRKARGACETAAAWTALERAHILSQSLLRPHIRVHGMMLGYAWSLGDAREVVGQAVRLALAPLGALTGRLPWGNTGRANVSAFRPMPIPADLAKLVEDARA